MNKRWRHVFGLAVLILLAQVYYLSQKEPPSEVVESGVAQPQARATITPKTSIVVAPAASPALADEATISELRSRAKLNLSALYTAQITFFSEFDRYSTDLVFIGWSPSQSPMDFKIGFLKEFRPAKLVVLDGTEEDPSRMDSDEFLGSDGSFQYTPAAESLKLHDYEKFCRMGCTATQKTFEILVVVPLGNSGKVDLWSITHDKKLRQLWDGVSGQVIKQTKD